MENKKITTNNLDSNIYTLFLCGGRWQLPWLSYLKTKGHKIILVDPYSNSPCVNHADVFFKEDVKNTDSIIKYILDNGFNIEAVTSEQTDVSALPVAIISKKLGLDYSDPSIVERFTNKGVSRSFLKKNYKTHFPEFKIINSFEELLEFINKFKNIIIKPVDSQSSRGVYHIKKPYNLNELKITYDICVSFSSEKQIIAEQFIEGNEITLEGICLNKKHYTLTGSNKKHFRTGIASELSYPLLINQNLKHELYAFHNDLIEKTGINNAITHAEYIIDEVNNNFSLVEMACRGGGSLIPSHIVPLVTKIDLYDLYYQAIFKKNNINNLEVENNYFVTLHFFEFPSGKVESIEGLERCKNFKCVIDIGLEFKVGDAIENAQDDRSRQGYVIVSGDSKESISSNLKLIYETISIKYVS